MFKWTLFVREYTCFTADAVDYRIFRNMSCFSLSLRLIRHGSAIFLLSLSLVCDYFPPLFHFSLSTRSLRPASFISMPIWEFLRFPKGEKEEERCPTFFPSSYPFLPYFHQSNHPFCLQREREKFPSPPRTSSPPLMGTLEWAGWSLQVSFF